jgi:hypothetical protein
MFSATIVDIGGRVTYLGNPSMRVTVSVTNYDSAGPHTIDAPLHLMMDNNSYRGLIHAELGGTCNNPATCPIRLNNMLQVVAQPIVCSESRNIGTFSSFHYTHNSRHSDCCFL